MAFSVSSIPNRIHRTFSNLRTGIVLLILVVIASALGTVILQRPATDPDKLTQAYSPAMLSFLDRVMLTNVFHSWWFLTLLGLVSLSIVLVSIDRFPNAWRFYARPYRKTDSHFRSALPNKVELPINNAEAGLNAAERAMKKLHWPVERIADQREPALYSERHRFSVMAVYLVHASLLLIFAGGIIDGVFGYSGFIALHKGQTDNVIELRTGGKKQLPFGVKCYSAGQENYADGSPKKWWSKLAIVQDGQEVSAKEIVVNDPLVYQGLRFYQSSYWIDNRHRRLAANRVRWKRRHGNTTRTTDEQACCTRQRHHRCAGRLHSRRLRARRPGLQEIRRHRERGLRSGSKRPRHCRGNQSLAAAGAGRHLRRREPEIPVQEPDDRPRTSPGSRLPDLKFRTSRDSGWCGPAAC